MFWNLNYSFMKTTLLFAKRIKRYSHNFCNEDLVLLAFAAQHDDPKYGAVSGARRPGQDGEVFMSEHDRSRGDVVLDSEPATRRLLRRSGVALEPGETPSGSALRHRLRNFVDRLFDITMPRTGEGEPAKRRGIGEEPAGSTCETRRFGRAQPAAARFGIATTAGGVLGWGDVRLGVPVRQTPTPRVILQLFGLITMLTLLGFGTSSLAVSQLRDTIQTISLQVKPAIGAAERLRIALGAMDVDAASDSLLGDAVSTGTSRDFAADVGAQIAAMVLASAGATLGDAETALRLQAMQYDLHLYYGALGEARDAGRSKPWIAAQRVKFASRLLRSHVMAQADAVEASNRRRLDDAYAQSKQQSLMLAACYIGVGILLAAVLIGAQIFLLRRTRRLINVPLAIATAVLMAAMLWVGVAVLQERADLEIGTTEALAQLVTLRQVKSAGYAINGDEAMWLIDHEDNRVDYERDFIRRARLVLGVDPADDAGLAQLQALYAAPDAAASPPRRIGLLGSLPRTGPGSGPTAAAITAFLDLLQIDAHLHVLEGKGDHRGALELRTGNKPGQGGFAFGQMDKALDAAIAVADTGFEQRITSATAITGWLPPIAGAALVLTLLLAAAGLWQRYQEYR